MSLTYRIKRLIKSDLNAWVEDLEEPKWVLAQAIRDMEEELERMDGAITAKESHLLKLKASMVSSQESLDHLERDIDFAVEEKREDIAKSLIRKMLITKQSLEGLTTEQASCYKELKEMEVQFKSRQEAYEQVKARSEHLNLPRHDDDAFAAAERLIPSDSTLEHQVDLEFLRRLQKSKTDQEEASHAE